MGPAGGIDNGDPAAPRAASDRGRVARIAWAGLSCVVVQCVVLALSAWPAAALLRLAGESGAMPPLLRDLVLAASIAPAYVVFAVALVGWSTLATRITGWRTPPDADLPLDEYSWPVLDWGRHLVGIHVVRLLVGMPFRSTPLWTAYLRLNGARVGRGTWINSLRLMDHNLLTIGKGAVIGSEASVSGHVVEHGRLRTARIVIGPRATIGVFANVGIGSTIGAGTHVGALSVVPKFSDLEAGATYVGAPVRKLPPRGTRTGAERPLPQDAPSA